MTLHVSGLRQFEPNRTYTVAVNGVLAAGERFGAFGRARDRRVAGTDLEALVAHVRRG